MDAGALFIGRDMAKKVRAMLKDSIDLFSDTMSNSSAWDFGFIAWLLPAILLLHMGSIVVAAT